MLDFYLIKNQQTKPEYPEQANLTHIAALDSPTFYSLVKKGHIDNRFDYYSDFRWDLELVKKIKSQLERASESDTDCKKLKIILDKAIASSSGVIAYSD